MAGFGVVDASAACAASARSVVGVSVFNMVVVGFMPRRTIDQTSDLRKGRIERISFRVEMPTHIRPEIIRKSRHARR
jgi:hypothetical protein